MFRLQTVDPETATGPVAEAYAVFPPGMGVPAPLRMLSASPALAGIQAQLIRYFMGHPRLDQRLLGLIRYLVAADQGYAFCTGFNGNLLKMFGLSDVDLEAIQDDPDSAPLADREKALLKFVLKTLRAPEEVGEEDVPALRQMGWQDSDILDALWHGGGMLAPARLMKALGIAC